MISATAQVTIQATHANTVDKLYANFSEKNKPWQLLLSGLFSPHFRPYTGLCSRNVHAGHAPDASGFKQWKQYACR
jgi:hypothetical protein